MTFNSQTLRFGKVTATTSAHAAHPMTVLPSAILILFSIHYGDVIMGTMASQTTSLTIVYSTVYSSADQRKQQRSASLAFVRGIHRGPVNSPHKWPVTRKMYSFDDVIISVSQIRGNALSGLRAGDKPENIDILVVRWYILIWRLSTLVCSSLKLQNPWFRNWTWHYSL